MKVVIFNTHPSFIIIYLLNLSNATPFHVARDNAFIWMVYCVLLRVYNNIVTTGGKGNGSFLVLLDLSAAFDTIDHDNLFYILEKYVGIGGSALRLIRSYFSDRTQRVQIDGIMSDFASLLCGVPQGSVLGPMKFGLYLHRRAKSEG